MRLVNQTAELIQQELSGEGLLKHVERCGRVCYKSEDKITDGSAERFVRMLLEKKHLSVLEHGTIRTGNDSDANNKVPFVRQSMDGEFCVTNLRDYLERMSDLDAAMSDVECYPQEPDKKKHKRVTLHVITSRAILDEFLRHRTLSASVESTRYCNYGKEKFGGVTFIIPSWAKENDEAFEFMKKGFEEAEYTYLSLLKQWDERKSDKRFRTGYKGSPLTPQQARDILPLGIKSEAYLTGFVDDWVDIIRKREIPQAHPDARELAKKIRCELIKFGYIDGV